MDPVRLGILGCGRGSFALAVADAAPGDLRVVACADMRRDRAESLAAGRPGTAVCESLEELLAAPDVDAVLVATPDHLHARHAIACLRAGRHVLSEIPAACTLDELSNLVDAALEADRRYMMGNEVRWFPALARARRWTEEGRWGTVFYGEAEYLHNLMRDGWRTVEPDGAPHWRWDPAAPQTTLLGGGPHAFDTLRWLADEPGFVETIGFGTGRSVTDHPEPSTAACLLRSARGGVYKVTVSYAMARPYCLYFSLYGDAGSFEGGRTDQEATFWYSDTEPGMQGLQPTGMPFWTEPAVPVVGHGSSEYAMLRAFVAAIREHRDPPIGPVEAAQSTAPAICALEAIRAGRPVAIPRFGWGPP
ncbi:MAG: Gfo/Idh/MocA family oxidoreductase [Chthonomonadales bacterium]|nr:Gfo/Idh/MocA family oxidoreductase [Chthonomonadales bacterium]